MGCLRIEHREEKEDTFLQVWINPDKVKQHKESGNGNQNPPPGENPPGGNPPAGNPPPPGGNEGDGGDNNGLNGIIPPLANSYKGSQTFPDFATLEGNYPKDNPDGTHAHPSADGYTNQCAIRLGVALQKSGVNMSTYNTGPVTSEGYPRGAKSLADWLWQTFGAPTIQSQSDFEKSGDYNKTGIIFIKAAPGFANHIDIYKGGRDTGSGYYEGEEIWFWPIK